MFPETRSALSQGIKWPLWSQEAEPARVPSHQGSHCVDGVTHGYHSFGESRTHLYLLESRSCHLLPSPHVYHQHVSPVSLARCFPSGTSEEPDLMEFWSHCDAGSDTAQSQS